MSRLDELNEILNGHAPKPKQEGVAGMMLKSGIQHVYDPTNREEKEGGQEGATVSAMNQDFGTKKDPAKLRKQVIRTASEDPIQNLLKKN